ncbi:MULTISPECIES: phosphoribosylamine--glycine ligase [Chromobacterium]|uniref:Phosphoribosylamine--glycine ligase n=1 Tax=Chromobacterium aquaticum TaxID=467180 RepID=A0ABV8ZP22_9NEIS|nr:MULTISPECIES: phosphoribosylamine--glycine ligase [Chromobacterium]KMN37975.1 phosphoribosylamine--glycine ligase [Chromobacterium sp. LK1]MCD5364037.1 phosphoribosylamine--glycine ligase [Chromobacterium aquaticum]
MKVMVIGSGGREHALAWRIAKSRRVSKVFVAPGNAGTALDPNLTNVELGSVAEWVAFAKQEKIELTVVGPEAPLAAGVVDAFRAEGLRIFGPTQYCAQLESSKDFAKAFMKRHGIPTAGYETFSDASAAHAYVDAKGAPIVIKADGLAAGKGVVVALTLDEAHAAIDDMLVGNKMGSAGARVVIEDFLQGEEASFIVMVDGDHVLPMATSQDHKRLLDNDQGPNTGGMGAYSPAPVVTPAVHNRVMREIILPTVLGMKKDGHSYTGFLYAGLMIDAQGNPHTIEFNCRFGDPETQPIMARLKSDFTVLLEAGVNGRLNQVEAEWDRRVALGVVLAAEGYPEAPRKGDLISGLPAESEDGMVFHAGVSLDADKQLRSNGGRVLCAVGLGDSVKMAQGKAYALADQVHFAGKQLRRDIGARAIGRKH